MSNGIKVLATAVASTAVGALTVYVMIQVGLRLAGIV